MYGSFVAEALARAGIGYLVLVDKDVISISNINRQIHSTTKTIGKEKTVAMKERILDINPNAIVETYLGNENVNGEQYIFDESFTYVVDAVDTIKTKLNIIKRADEIGVRVISSMGAGNKLDPSGFMVSDIYKTSVCKLAKKIRKEVKKLGIKKLKVVYTKEESIKNIENEKGNNPIR